MLTVGKLLLYSARNHPDELYRINFGKIQSQQTDYKLKILLSHRPAIIPPAHSTMVSEQKKVNSFAVEFAIGHFKVVLREKKTKWPISA